MIRERPLHLAGAALYFKEAAACYCVARSYLLKFKQE